MSPVCWKYDSDLGSAAPAQGLNQVTSGRHRLPNPREGYTRRVLWAWIWIVFALLVNGLIFRWLGGFVGAGQAVERWGERSAKRWARRRGMKGF